MTLDDYNGFCASLPATNHVVQWGGAHVWKVGDKVFAVGGWDQGQQLFVTFKCSDIAY
ncbi:MmcQ/YjbR family DNA-binding protein, partial [Mesorhizobium sp. M7A.F.Ca.CA.004.06.1.1]